MTGDSIVVKNPRTICAALNDRLVTCGIPFAMHGKVSHEFQRRAVRKHHVPWKLIGTNHAYCGRTPHHMKNPEDMQWVPAETDAAVRRLARQNLICTACFKNWMYLKNRNEFIGAVATW